MTRMVGAVSRGVRAPVIKKGDDLLGIVCDCVVKASEQDGFKIQAGDIIGVTEAVLARSQGNYADCDDIARDIRSKFPDGTIGLIFPILSRNRFAICLKGIAMGVKKIYMMLSYPSDEVGNHLVSLDEIDAHGINPYTDVLSEKRFRELFGYKLHPFTGVDYIAYYRQIVEEAGAELEYVFANDARKILDYTKNVLCADIHSRERSKRLLRAAGAELVYGLDDILASPVGDSGYNENYGLLGANKSTETTIKLFPRNSADFVAAVQAEMLRRTGARVEVLVYGDGAFKDPVGKIWELADPVVSPGYTSGLEGQPNELKIKYMADNDFGDLSGEALQQAITKQIANKGHIETGSMALQGTTPRNLSDLVGSLCDLTSGSGDKGTPIIYIQGYFDNYAVD